MSGAGSRVVVLSAPSGWGKTVAAAHFVDSVESAVIWLDARGASGEIGRVVDAISCHVVSGSPEGAGENDGSSAAESTGEVRRGAIVVIDDVGSCESDFLDSLRRYSQRHSECDCRFILTTRDRAGTSAALETHAVVLTEDDLRLSRPEAQAIQERLGAGCEVHVESLLDACCGHAGMFGSLVRGFESPDAWNRSAVEATAEVVARMLRSAMSVDEIALLITGCVLGSGVAAELPQGVRGSHFAALVRAQEAVPVFGIDVGGQPAPSFRISELAEKALFTYLWSDLPEVGRHAATEEGLLLLLRRGDGSRACRIAGALLDNGRLLSWADRSHETLSAVGAWSEIDGLLSRLDLQELLDFPALLTCWSSAARELGEPDLAASRARAAVDLLRGEGPSEGLVRAMLGLVKAEKQAGRLVIANGVADALPLGGTGCLDLDLAAMVEKAGLLLSLGRMSEGAEAVERAAQLSKLVPDSRSADVCRADNLWALAPALIAGDYAEMVIRAGRQVAVQKEWDSDRIPLLSNFALGLLETGRPRQALALTSRLVDTVGDYYQSTILSTRGLCMVAQGDAGPGLLLCEQALEIAKRSGLEADLALGSVQRASVMRSLGRPEEALESAERASALFSIVNYFGHSSMAQLEMAAAMMDLGEIRRALDLADGCASHAGLNKLVGLRGDMIRSQIAVLEGDLEGAAALLRPHREFVGTGSANWQLGLSIRACPQLLEVARLAWAEDGIPAAVLRLVEPATPNMRATGRHGRSVGEHVRIGGVSERLDHRAPDLLCEVELFGSFSVRVRGVWVQDEQWQKRKSRLLFAMLVLECGRELARDRVLDALWPEMSRVRALNNFYVTWSSMRRALGEDGDSKENPIARCVNGRCRVLQSNVHSDVYGFRNALARARAFEGSGDGPAAIASYETACNLYAGDLMPGDEFEEWLAPQRDAYRREFVNAASRLAELLREHGRVREALVLVQRALDVDPTREDLYREKIRCCLELGERSGAVSAFVACREILADELGLSPARETMNLYQQVLELDQAR
jgi:DNA-binding SARP family transcriptional activator